MEQFTASEVRDAITWKYGDKLTRISAMLTAFADLLEAREKAVPVGYISADDIRELDANREDDAECAEAIEMLIASRPFASNHTAIYTHPAPSDAERLEPPSNLQEALCVIENAALHGVTLHGDDIPRLRATVDRIAPAQQSQDAERLAEALRELVVACEEHDAMVSRIIGHPAGWNAQYLNSAREALAAHSARTPWTEGEKAHFKAAAELVAQREAAQAQPPAVMPEQTHYVAEVIDDCRRRALDLEWDMKNKWPEWSQDEAVLGIICVAQNLQASLGSLGATMKAQPPSASVTGAVEVSFEVWQDDEMVAECSGPEPSALHEARHYAAQYSQDGAVKLFRVSRVAISAAQENPNG